MTSQAQTAVACVWAWQRPGAQTAGEARAAARTALAGWGIAAVAGDVTVMVSELVTNACEHGAAPVELALRLAIRRDGCALVGEVTDAGTGIPELTAAQPGGEHGRGLAIVAALAGAFGVRPLPRGKTVWFRVVLPGRPGSGTVAA
jgi:anti-sigma regulatory factor (Ser/Thr protein kinase)